MNKNLYLPKLGLPKEQTGLLTLRNSAQNHQLQAEGLAWSTSLFDVINDYQVNSLCLSSKR